MKPKVSILVAAYNVSDYLSECLKSIQNQTYSNFEVIIIDDGSTDQTLKIAKETAKDDVRFKVIHQKNQGLSAVRNRGIKEATGEYIAFVDGDDWLNIYFLEKLIEDIVKNKSDISVCGFESIPDHKKESPAKQCLSGEQATINLLTMQENYQIVSWNKLYKKSLFENIEFPVGKKHEDSLTTYKVFAAAKKVSFINDSLYYYRVRKGSIMSSVKLNDRLNQKLGAAVEAKEYFKSNIRLRQAAEISELLAYFTFLDNIIASRLKIKPYFVEKWLKENKVRLFKNPLLTKKLKVYLISATNLDGISYKIFRKIKH